MSQFFDIYSTANANAKALPTEPLFWICLKSYGERPDGVIVLGGSLASQEEANFQIDQMISELNALRPKFGRRLR